MRWIHYRRKYNDTVETYEFHLILQQGCCACCGRSNNYKNSYFDMDHDHYTGEIRGLLCTDCNRLVGKAENLWDLSGKNKKKVEKYLTGRVLFVIL